MLFGLNSFSLSETKNFNFALFFCPLEKFWWRLRKLKIFYSDIVNVFLTITYYYYYNVLSINRNQNQTKPKPKSSKVKIL